MWVDMGGYAWIWVDMGGYLVDMGGYGRYVWICVDIGGYRWIWEDLGVRGFAGLQQT